MSSLFERLPKYVQIKERLREDIDGGILEEGEQLPPESVLIERFSASKMTVIRSLQELVQEGYLCRVQGKGTYVTHPKKDTPIIGVLVPRADLGIFTRILRGAEEQAHQLGYEVSLCSTDEDMSKVCTFAERLISRKAAGVIAAPLERIPDPSGNVIWYNQFQDNKIPVVMVDRGLDAVKSAPLVQSNNEDAMAELTQEVLNKGHRRILYVRLTEIISTTADRRLRGFVKTIEECTMIETADVISISEHKSFAKSIEEFEENLREYKPTVLMCANDQIAIRIFSMLQNSSQKVVGDISITGFDDMSFAQAVGLTTVRQPLEEEGREAVNLLHRIIQGGKNETITLKSTVIERTSLAQLEE